MLKNDRFLKAIRREPVDRTPIWIMRQAGRYLPEYRATRQRAGSFLNLCKTPELACEVTLQPLARYALDASIIFSDILTIPDAMGLGLQMVEGKGPQFIRPLTTPAAIDRLVVPEPDTLQYVYDAIKLVQQELAAKVPLIGFCGSPWTLAAYMVEGRANPGFPVLQALRDTSPEYLHKLLNILSLSVAQHLRDQITAGVQAVMIFDSWGGLLDTPGYETFSLPYIKQAVEMLKHTYNKKDIPIIVFTKGGAQWLEQIAAVGCDMIGVDWLIGLDAARARVGDRIALQGNLNPACLLEAPQVIVEETKRILAAFGHGSGHVFNLGHGITPDVPPAHVSVLVDAVHEFSERYHH